MNTQKNIITKPTPLKRGLSVPVKIRLQPIKKRNEKIMKATTIIRLGNILTVKSEYPQSSSILPEKSDSGYKFHRNF